MKAPLRFAILGFGHHAVRRLIPAFAKSGEAVLTGMWRRNRAEAARDCLEYKIPVCFPSPEELCSSSEIDAVFITSPDALHRDDALLALQQGKAVLCEKPLTINVLQAEEMVQAAERAGLLLGVAQNFRYNASLQWMREQVQAGVIGRPQLAHAQFDYPAHNSARKWITNLELACGGPIADVGVHCIDSLRYVLGQDVLDVSTLAYADAASDVETHASLQLAMTGDVCATVSVSARAPYRTLVEIVGSEGALIAENGLTVDRPVEVVHAKAGEVVARHTFDNSDGYTRMIDSFARALRGEESFLATGPDGVHNMRVLDAAYRSWRSGQREAIPS